RVGTRLIPRAERHGGSFLEEATDHGLADSLASPGHQRHATLKRHRPIPMYWNPFSPSSKSASRFFPSRMSGSFMSERIREKSSALNAGHSVSTSNAEASRAASSALSTDSNRRRPSSSARSAFGSYARTRAPASASVRMTSSATDRRSVLVPAL